MDRLEAMGFRNRNKMRDLILHCGAKNVGLNDLKEIEMPEQTDTYIPISHYDMAFNVNKVAQDLLVPKGYKFVKEQYGLGREGQRLFGVFQFRNGQPDMGMAVGFRNSYDKSMSAGLCIGAQVFVCDNLAFNGDIVVMRKHTKNVLEDFQAELIQAVYKSVNNFDLVVNAMARMKTIDITDDDAYKAIGMLAGHEILTSTEVNETFRQWRKPSYDAFADRNVYSLYNAATCALRTAPPHRLYEAHAGLHETVVKYFNVA